MSADLGLHAAVKGFQVENGCLVMGGQPVTEVVDDYGGTPIYVYDGQLIQERVQHLRQSLPAAIHLHFAIKANPMLDVVRLISGIVDGLDVASSGELEVALTTECNTADISFAGPGKTIRELEIACAAGVTLNVESATELSRIADIAKATNFRPAVAVRVNPNFELKSSGMKMSGGPKQFGIDAELVPDILRQIGEMPLDFAGFHIFSGSQNLRPEAICESQSKAVELALDLSKFAPRPPRMLNIGGGFGIPYFPGDDPLDLNPIANNLSALLEKVGKRIPSAQLVLELGRYIVGEAGVYLCKILDRKVSRGQVFLVTNGGLHHHLAASGNFGQVIRKNYPVAIANRLGSESTETASVVGPLCTPLDLLADRMTLAEAQIGDLVAVFQSGAYGFTASPHLFLGHPPPGEVLV